MAVDKLVDSAQLDADLTSVANAIRTKGGTSASLAFPSGFVSAINAISGGGAGGDTYVKTTYTLASQQSINAVINSANIPLISQNEVLIWNIKGTTKQTTGSVAGKMGITVVQNGTMITNASGYKRASSAVAPNSMTPSTSWTNGAILWISNGHYYAGTGNTFYVGAGNTVEFLQIPYDIGWST